MRRLFSLAIATVASLVTESLAAPIIAHPGSKNDIIITADNTLNGTTEQHSVVTYNPLQISIHNNLVGSSSLKAYVTGQDSNGVNIFLDASGSWYYPVGTSGSTPVAIEVDLSLPVSGYGKTTVFVLPDYISSARVWISQSELQFFTLLIDGVTQLVEPSFANPSDPSAAVDWGFIELTNNKDGIFANLSFVDFVGLVMGMSLKLADGAVQTVKGLKQGAVASICADLKAQTAVDGQPWDNMCVTDTSGKALRVLSPNIYTDINRDAMATYYDSYIDQVWSTYSSKNLTIDTQLAIGKVQCRVKDDLLTCNGDNRSYARPTVRDIFGCNSGTFSLLEEDNAVHYAVVPRLCAAFNRGTLLANGGSVQPSLGESSYYKTSPNNHYSRIVHTYETDGLGYAFSYDDVNPTGENAAGTVSGPNPVSLQITVGGLD